LFPYVFFTLWFTSTVCYSASPVASFVADPTSDTVGAPVAVQFTDTSVGTPTSWLWDFDDGLTSTEQHPQHPFYASGTYSVSLTVDNGEGQDTIIEDYIVPVCNTVSPVLLDYDQSTYDTIMEAYDYASIDSELTDITLKIMAGTLVEENV